MTTWTRLIEAAETCGMTVRRERVGTVVEYAYGFSVHGSIARAAAWLGEDAYAYVMGVN